MDLRENFRSGCLSMARDHKVCAALDLNDELLISIVTRLCMPLQKIFELRSVCKAWKTALADQQALKYFFQLLSQTPLYIVYECRSDDDLPAWDHLAACDIRIKNRHTWVSAAHSEYFSAYEVHGEAGEWLLVKKKSDPLQSLFLANPTKRSRRKLPSLLDEGGRFLSGIGMGFDEGSKSCKVFAVDHLDYHSRKVYLYDFELDSWKAFGAWQINEGGRMYSMVFYEGSLYCFIKTKDGGHSVSNVCRFDESCSLWQTFSAQISGQLLFEQLFEWQGHLMLIGVRERGQHHESRLGSVHIWQLDQRNQVWVESMRMPDHLVDHFLVANTGVLFPSFYFTCATCNDQLCLTSETTDADCKDRSRHVMCDLSKALWWDVPEPPFPYYDDSTFSVLLPISEFQSC